MLYNGQKVTLIQVRYIINFRRNLISYERVKKSRYHVYMIDGWTMITIGLMFMSIVEIFAFKRRRNWDEFVR